MYVSIRKVLFVFAKAPDKKWLQVSKWWRTDKQLNKATKETENVLNQDQL